MQIKILDKKKQPHKAPEDGGGAENKVQQHMVGCIINRHPENNAVRKFKSGGRGD